MQKKKKKTVPLLSHKISNTWVMTEHVPQLSQGVKYHRIILRRVT